MNLTTIHAGLSRTALFFTITLALWAFWQFIRKEKMSPGYRGALAIGEILFIAQGLLGGVLYLIGERPERGGVHILYGFVTLLVIPALYTYTKGDDQPRVLVIYGVALLFLVGVLFRAMATGT